MQTSTKNPRSQGEKFFPVYTTSLCDTRNLRGDYHTLGFTQQKSKLSSVEIQNS